MILHTFEIIYICKHTDLLWSKSFLVDNCASDKTKSCTCCYLRRMNDRFHTFIQINVVMALKLPCATKNITYSTFSCSRAISVVWLMMLMMFSYMYLTSNNCCAAVLPNIGVIFGSSSTMNSALYFSFFGLISFSFCCQGALS